MHALPATLRLAVAIATGISLSAGWLRLDGRRALLRGSFPFLTGLVAMALSAWYALAFVLLLIGGLGTAAFSNMQTTVILTEAPPTTRSRVMGIDLFQWLWQNARRSRSSIC